MPKIPYARWKQMHDRYHNNFKKGNSGTIEREEWDQFKLEVLESFNLCRVPHRELTLLHRIFLKHGEEKGRYFLERGSIVIVMDPHNSNDLTLLNWLDEVKVEGIDQSEFDKPNAQLLWLCAVNSSTLDGANFLLPYELTEEGHAKRFFCPMMLHLVWDAVDLAVFILWSCMKLNQMQHQDEKVLFAVCVSALFVLGTAIPISTAVMSKETGIDSIESVTRVCNSPTGAEHGEIHWLDNSFTTFSRETWLPEKLRRQHMKLELIFDGLELLVASMVGQFFTLQPQSSHTLDAINYLTTAIDLVLVKGVDFFHDVLLP